MMINEQYVSFETAKLLKEKGFDEKCSHYWQEEIEDFNIPRKICRWTDGPCANSEIDGYRISAPSQSLVMRWLREVHHLHIDIDPSEGDWKPQVIDLDDNWCTANTENIPIQNTYEEACEAAIKYCLEKLI